MSKVNAGFCLSLAASSLIWAMGGAAQQPKLEQPARAHPLSAADSQTIQDIVKAQEKAWNTHDMDAFTKSFRDDVEGINVVGMYWRGKAEILKHLSDYHKTIFKDLEETVEEVKVHSIGDEHAIAVSIWKVGSFKAPNGVEVPACRHRSTLVLAKDTDGWKVVHFHNTTIDEAAVKASGSTPKK
ncbi:YybH family protein [Singulisphaera rosea]